MKRCSKCGIEKEESEFSKGARHKDELQYYCKKCQSVSDKEYYQKNKEKIAECKKEYRQKNKEKMNNWERMKRRKHRFNLADDYVVNKIANQFKIPVSEITQELIELKRIELSNKRLINKLKENETK